MSVSVVAGKPSVGTGEQNITWAPISSPVRMNFIGTSYNVVATALIEAFGQFPIRLDKSHSATLRGMVAVAGEGKTPYQDLLNALQQFGQLEVCLV